MANVSHQSVFTAVLPSSQRRLLGVLILLWLLGSISFWHWSFQPTVWVSQLGTLFNLVLLVYVTGIPLWPFLLLSRMRQVRPDLSAPQQLRVAMIVTKAPSEPWSLVQDTLLAMLEQDPAHDTWLADEAPTHDVRLWCDQHGVQLSSREHEPEYHRSTWPRRRRCKEGNLAYFYDQYGYSNYDVVVQLDADHVPQKGYLLAVLQPFNDPKIGYVAAPSICNQNASRSWVARGRLYAEAMLHGPMQLGCNNGLAPLCIGSHYAVRTQALRDAGGLGPELAEDHSTTLLLNAKGWKGAFAHRAICHGLGPETFEDAMVQEFQWSRSLTIILLRYLPSRIRNLPFSLRLQFLYAQIFYPLRGTLTLAGLVLPVLALVIDRPWMSINYPNFLLLSALQMLLTVLPVFQVRRCGLLRPASAPIFSWEQALFELSRGPWILAGVITAVDECIRPRPIDFKVTQKHAVTQPLPVRFLVPYHVSALVALTTILAFADLTRSARGYVLLTLLSALLFSLTAMAVALLSHCQSRQPLRCHLPQICGSACILLAAIVLSLCRWHDLIQTFQL
jgi:cellulose synthase (UDP-forming)